MVDVKPVTPKARAASNGYLLSAFEVATRTDLYIAGVRLPRAAG